MIFWYEDIYFLLGCLRYSKSHCFACHFSLFIFKVILRVGVSNSLGYFNLFLLVISPVYRIYHSKCFFWYSYYPLISIRQGERLHNEEQWWRVTDWLNNSVPLLNTIINFNIWSRGALLKQINLRNHNAFLHIGET